MRYNAHYFFDISNKITTESSFLFQFAPIFYKAHFYPACHIVILTPAQSGIFANY